MPSHPFLAVVLEHFGVELVNLVINSTALLSVFVYLSEVYLRSPTNLELFKYYYGISK